MEKLKLNRDPEHVKYRYITHAFNYTASYKKDYCFWCGIHQSGRSYIENSQEFTQEDWNTDVEAITGESIKNVRTKIDQFYAKLSSSDRKQVSCMNPMGHPYPSLLT